MIYKKCEVCSQFAKEDELEEATIVMTKHISCPITPTPVHVPLNLPKNPIIASKPITISDDLALINAVNNANK